MNDSPMDDYIAQVDRHLILRGRARQQALDDLRDALREAAEAIDEAIALTGDPQDYASALNEQFADSNQEQPRTIFGMPNSFTRGIGDRIAGTFDPSDERLIIPRVFGLGWTINMGAVAVRLGLLNADDVDDEILADAAERLTPAQITTIAAIAASGVAAGAFFRHRSAAKKITGKSQTGNLIAAALLPLISAALLAASTDPGTPPNRRLTLPSVAASLALVATGASLQSAIRPGRQSIVVVTTLTSLPLEFLLSYWPVRIALKHSQSTGVPTP